MLFLTLQHRGHNTTVRVDQIVGVEDVNDNETKIDVSGGRSYFVGLPHAAVAEEMSKALHAADDGMCIMYPRDRKDPVSDGS